MADFSFLPYGKQIIEEDDIAAVTSALQSDFLTTGPLVAQFEEAFCAVVSAGFSISCSSATAGLHLACAAVGLKENDLAIVPANTFVATANAVRYCGADVVFADVNPETGMMGIKHLRDTLARLGPDRKRVRVILPVYFAGEVAEVEEIYEEAKRLGAMVIEDAAHALGSRYQSKDGQWHIVGACDHSDLAVFSFHPVKTITMGEGGVVSTQNSDLAKRVALLRSHGIERNKDVFTNKVLAFAENGSVNPWYYEMTNLGWNYRVTDIQCALGMTQLQKLDRFGKARQSLVGRYRRQLSDRSPYLTCLKSSPHCKPVNHLFVILIDFEALGISRGDLIQSLKDDKIGTQVHYVPVLYQPYYQALYPNHPDLPGVRRYYDQCLSLPLYPTLEMSDVDRVVQSLKNKLEIQ